MSRTTQPVNGLVTVFQSFTEEARLFEIIESNLSHHNTLVLRVTRYSTMLLVTQHLDYCVGLVAN